MQHKLRQWSLAQADTWQERDASGTLKHAPHLLVAGRGMGSSEPGKSRSCPHPYIIKAAFFLDDSDDTGSLCEGDLLYGGVPS